MQQSLSQKRAKHALDLIQETQNAGGYGNYLAYVKALPATIIMSGLGQALAMEKAGRTKSGDVGAGHKKLYAHMEAWLCNYDKNGWETSPYAQKTNILEAITNGTEADYIRAQVEAMEYLEWLKKFAVAFLVEGKDGDDQ